MCMVCGGCPGMMWIELYPLCVTAANPLLLWVCQCIFFFFSISLHLIWSPEIENYLRETKIKFGHGEILSVTAVFTTCADPFVSLIGGDHAVGINDLASWKMDAIWTGPGRSGSGLQRAETCHLSTHATAWSFYHLALTRSLILGLCRYETQWVGTRARLHRQEFKPGMFFFPSVKPV